MSHIYTWFKYILISLINISKKVIFRTAQKYKCISFIKYIQPLYVQQSLILELPHKGASFFSFIWKQEVMYSYLCEKNKETHSFSLSLTNIYGMSGIMKTIPQLKDLEWKNLVTHCTMWNDNLLLETRAAFSILFRGYHRTGDRLNTVPLWILWPQSEHTSVNTISRVPTTPQ